MHGFCTVGVFVGILCMGWIALKCVVNFASGQQCQPELRLYFGVCILQKFQ